jgi:hypothetical protein
MIRIYGLSMLVFKSPDKTLRKDSVQKSSDQFTCTTARNFQLFTQAHTRKSQNAYFTSLKHGIANYNSKQKFLPFTRVTCEKLATLQPNLSLQFPASVTIPQYYHPTFSHCDIP